MDYLECGTIWGGPCSGDELWGIGIYQADDQEGCARKGIEARVALVRKIEVRGKCASRCSLGSSIIVWNPPVNNWGSVKRTANKKADNETKPQEVSPSA